MEPNSDDESGLSSTSEEVPTRVISNWQKRLPTLAELPELGEPGGKDDPLRKGLSGAGVRWYLRYLSSGIDPEEARRKALEHKMQNKTEATSQSPKRKVSWKDVDGGNDDEEEGAEVVQEETTEVEGIGGEQEENIPKLQFRKKRRCRAIPLNSIRVAITPVDYPEQLLSAEEQTNLEKAIIDEIALGWHHELSFNSIQFKVGMIFIVCATQETADWLIEKTPTLCNWNGVPLKTWSGDNFPKTHIITLFIPKSNGIEVSKILKLLEVQNADLNVPLWKVHSYKKNGPGQVLVIGIDEKAVNIIKERDFKLNYRFGTIPVHGLRKNVSENRTFCVIVEF